MFPKNIIIINLVLNIDSNNNISTIIDKFKEIQNVQNDLDKFVSSINALKSSGVKAGMQVRSLYKQFEHLDEGLISTSKAFLEGTATSDDFNKAIKQATSTSSKFATTLKNVAANIAIMVGVSLAIKAVTWAWDEMTTTVAEAQEEYDKLSSSIKTLTSELETLKSRDFDSLSQSEKDRLQYLEDRIELEEKLLEIQQKRQYQAQLGTEWNSVFDKDSNKNQLFWDEWQTGNDYSSGNSHIQKYEESMASVEKLQQRLQDLENSGITTDNIVYKTVENQLIAMREKAENASSALANDVDDYYTNMTDAKFKIEEIQAMLDSGLLNGTDKKLAEEQLADYQRLYDFYEKLYNKVNNIIHTPQSAVDSILERLGNNITKEELTSAFDADELEILLEATFDKNASIDDLREIIAKAQKVADDNPIEFSIEAHTDSIDKFQSKVNSLSDVLKKVSQGKLSKSELIDLIQEFPELAKETENLEDAIKSLIDEGLQDLLDTLGEGVPPEIEDAIKGIAEEAKNFNEVIGATPLDKIQSLSTGLDQLDKIYADIKDKGEFDFSSIFNNEDFANTFNVEGVKEEYEDFLKVVSSSPTDINACQTAFNNLADAYIRNSGALDDLTEETKAQAIAMLEQMGVANATAVVEAELAAQEAYLKIKTDDTNRTLRQQVEELLGQSEAGEVAYSTLFELCEQMEIFANKDLSIDEKVNQLEQLALAFGLAKAEATDLNSIESYKKGAEAAARYGDAQGRKGQEAYDAAMEEAYQLMKNDYLGQIEDKFDKVRAKYTGGSTTKKLTSTSSKTKETKQFFDYTANSIQNLQNELDTLNTKLENTTGWKKQLEIQQQIIEAQKNLRQGYISQAEAYKNYYKEVSKGLTKQQKADIESGKVFRVQEYGQDTYDKLTKAQSAYQDWQDALKNVDNSLLDISETADVIANIPLEKATEKVETFTKRIEDLVKTLDTTDGLSLDEVHALYNKQRKNYTKIYMEHLSAEADAKNSLIKESSELKKSIKGETKAKQKYVKEQISNNKVIDTSKLKTKKAKEAAVEYNSALEASKTATKNVKTALKEYTSALQELAKSEIDRIINHYDNYSGLSEAKQQRFKTQIDMLEAQGYTADDDYYKKLIDISDREINRLEKESDRITSLMNNGNLSEDDYFDALQSLYDIAEEIDKCKLNQIEWNKAIQQIEFDKFDKLQERISSIITEATFMISLLDEDKYFDDDGNMTDEGLTAQALHAQNYNTYLAQSEKYGKEIKKVNALLANDPANQTLIDRRNELIEAQQNAILSAHSEKEAIIDLIEEGYNAQIDAMSELVDAKQKLLDKEKELHDYQKSIREQQTDITVLRKQIVALENSSDRADRAKLLKLKEQLKEAEGNLAEDQYQHSIDTQKDALDEALEEYIKRTEEYLENEEELFEETIDNINSHATDVLESIKDKAESVGYELSESIINIWSNTAPIDSFEDAVIDSFTGIGNAIQNVVNKLDQMYQKYQEIANTNMNDVIKDIEDNPDKETATESASKINPQEVKRILGNASGKAGASNTGDSILNEYISGLGYGMLSRDEMIELAQALGLKEITDLETLRASGGTSIIKDALEKYLNSGYSVVDELEKTSGVSKANQQNIISLIQGANKYTGETGKLSDLNKYIYSNYNKKWLNKGQMVALAQYLGYSSVASEDDITASLKTKMLNKLKKAGFRTGGVVEAVGEDGIALVKNKEVIFTPKQYQILQDSIKPMNYMAELAQSLYKSPNVTPVNRNMGNVTVQVDVHGNMDNVTLAQMNSALKDTMQETLKATPDYLMGVTRKFGR